MSDPNQTPTIITKQPGESEEMIKMIDNLDWQTVKSIPKLIWELCRSYRDNASNVRATESFTNCDKLTKEDKKLEEIIQKKEEKWLEQERDLTDLQKQKDSQIEKLSLELASVKKDNDYLRQKLEEYGKETRKVKKQDANQKKRLEKERCKKVDECRNVFNTHFSASQDFESLLSSFSDNAHSPENGQDSVNKLEKLGKVLQFQVAHMMTEFERRDKHFQDREQEFHTQLQQQRDSIQKATERINGEKQEQQRLKCKFEEEMEKYRSRLAAMSEKKVQTDQRKVENTLSRNRRSNVEHEFKRFFDNERIDACETVKSCYTQFNDFEANIVIPRLLCMIFETAYQTANVVRNGFWNISNNTVLHLVSHATEIGVQYEKHNACYLELKGDLRNKNDTEKDLAEQSSGIVDGLLLMIKENVHAYSMEKLVQETKQEIENQWFRARACHCLPTYHPDVNHKLKSYVEKCVSLAWRMVTQMPPLQLDFVTERFNKIWHDDVEHHPYSHRSGSWAQSSPIIACYLWPTLHDGKNVLQKGKVVLSKSRA